MSIERNKDQLRQSLLELHYDLLDEEEASKLREAIATKPDVAAEWAATLAWAGKLADAAKLDGSALGKVDLTARLVDSPPSSNGNTLTDDPIIARVVGQAPSPAQPAPARRGDAGADESGPTSQPARPQTSPSDRPPVSRDAGRRWWVRSTVLAATAAAIGMMVIGSSYLDRIPASPMAVVRLEAQPLAAGESTLGNVYRFVTTRLDASSTSNRNRAVTPANLAFSVVARNAVLFSGTAQTDDQGAGRISLPPELVVPKEARLQVTASSPDGTLAQSSISVPLEPTRCLTYVVVDRPVYRPGETVFFRSLTLQRRSLRVNADVPIRFELLDPSGAVVPGAVLEGVTDDGVGNGSFLIPSAAAGGPYTLLAKSLDGFFPDERCEFQVRAYRVPRVKKDLEFRRRSFGPGERVEADFSAVRAEGGPVDGADIRVAATVDGKVIYRLTTTTDATGSCLISFALPTLISDGAGQLSVTIDDGGTRETKTKTIPIQLGRVSVDFYPEGGYLVGGLQNRVYFAARDSLGKPIHVKGEILSRAGQSVAEIETRRDGMGRFRLQPVRGERYTLKVTEPIDVTNSPRLPSVVKDLPVVDTGSGVFDSGQPITIVIRSTQSIDVLVRAVCRGRLVGQQQLRLRAGDNSLSLPIGDDEGGVIRLTVLDPSSVPALPLVERLVFRRIEQRLNVEILEDTSALEGSPGEPLRLTLQVRDETGQPTPAVLGVAVVDDAALSLEETERPQLRTHFLLTSEIEKPEDLEHANFYLSEEESAAESLDLLLGTQGWRRFVSGSSDQARVDFREQLIRLLELDGPTASAAPQRFSNAGLFQRRWDGYRETVQTAWHRLVTQARILMLVVLFLWLLSILFHLRRHARLSVMGWLLVGTTSLLLYGCGAREAMVVDSSVAESAADEAVESEEYVADMSMPVAEPMDAPRSDDEPPPPASVPPANMGDAADVIGMANQGAPAPDAMVADPAAVFNDGTGQWEDQDGARRIAWTTLPGGATANRRSLTQQDLEKLLAARGLDAETLADSLLDELRFPIRQYAHRHPSGDSEVRDDFAETLYWQPMLRTDSQGRATIRFDLSDSVTTFAVNVDGHSMDGRIGSGGGQVTSRLPFQIEPKLPLEVTMGDRIDLPIAVINATDGPSQVELSLTADASLQPIGDTTRSVSLSADQRRRENISLDVVSGSAESDATITIRGVGTGSLRDSITRRVHIAPAGYPARESLAGRLSERATVQLPIPEEMVAGSLAVTVRAFPSPIADVMSGVESILREPHGCFEQASATNYPNTMALLYLEESRTSNPQVSRRAMGMLDRGYQKLIGFECDKLGYEWFGDDPGHEALSAFGLMQFTDMSRVMTVSEQMIDRTRTWLLGRRDGKGGFQRNPRHLHAWSVQQPIVNAYVLWAISEADVAAGQPNRTAGELAAELDQLARVAATSNDPYLIALSAAALMNVKRTGDGEELLQKLVSLQRDDGSLQGTTTVTSSGGLSRTMETTALAVLAWVKSPRFVPQAQLASKWISANRLAHGGFGSTQATVLALKALVAMSGHSPSQAGGTLQVRLGGELIGSAELPEQPRSGSAVEVTGLGAKLAAAQRLGDQVEIELVGRGVRNLSYTIDIACHVLTPRSDGDCAVSLSTAMTGEMAEDGSVPSGATLKVSTRLENTTDQGQPMTVAIVGLPGGVEPRAEELDELREAGRFDFYELRGREVVFYWRTLPPRWVHQVDFHVTASISGKYTGPASRAYLYYTAEQKQWIDPLSVEIKP